MAHPIFSRRRFLKRKVCVFCKERAVEVDYKNQEHLQQFVTDRGKIIPRRITGTCAKHQRKLTMAIKRARVLSILPFTQSLA